MTTVVVVGYGSIGARHTRILRALGLRTAVVSKREVDVPLRYATLIEALQTENPDYVVVANATGEHHEALTMLMASGFKGAVLVEKPLFDHIRPIKIERPEHIFVAYNLRFHAVLQRLKQLIIDEQILSAQIYAGQYLPDWRPGTDYRNAYSASAERGGGVLRDLSHELDYIVWLFGGWTRVAALGGHLSPLEINSEDIFALMMVTPACPIVNLEINYMDRPGRRKIIVNTARFTVEADLVQGTISMNGIAEAIATERDDSYLAMHKAALANNTETLCTFAEGHETMQLIEAAETAARTSQWVIR